MKKFNITTSPVNNRLKVLFLLLLTITGTVYSQTATIRPVSFKPNPKFQKIKSASITFPVISTKNKVAGELINGRIREEVFGSSKKGDLSKAINGLTKHGLTDLSYKVTLNRNYLLSIHISQQQGDDHVTATESYLNFDLESGKDLEIEDLLAPGKTDSFYTMVIRDKKENLNAYNDAQKDSLQKNKIDSSTYTWALGLIYDCTADTVIRNFSLSTTGITMINPCELPGIIKYLEPGYTLYYPYKSLAVFLKPTFQYRLIK